MSGPVSNDGVVDLPGECDMAETTMRGESNAILEQTAIAGHQAWLRDGERHSGALTNVAEQTKVLFLEEKFKVGVREAASTQRLDDNKLAENILAQRSAGQQPQAAGGPQPVKPA